MKTNSTSKLVVDRHSTVHRRNDLRLALLETIKSFCRKTSVHGMKFIVDEENDENELFKLSSTRKKVSRFIWFLICLMGISMAIGLVVTFYGKFQTRPITTSIETTTYPIWGLDFPGVTICNINKVYSPNTRNITEKL
jgi:Amiloride-sensitive sodium channel